MSYLGFHLTFILPPIALLAVGLRGRLRRVHPRAGLFLALIAAIALVYTTPWDNYLVWRGVWGYGPDRVLGTIGYVPVEEYLFFVLQPLLAGLWLYRVLVAGYGSRSTEGADSALRAPRSASRAGAGLARAVGGIAYLLLSAFGVWLLFRPWGTYLGLILAWAGPVLALQWAYAGGEIWARRRAWLVGVAVPTLYLWVADAVAIRLGIWSIAEPFTTGILLFGLPLEEASFFLVTNLLVVQGLMLFLYPPHAAPGSSPVVNRQSSVVSRRSSAGPDRRPGTEDRRPKTGAAEGSGGA